MPQNQPATSMGKVGTRDLGLGSPTTSSGPGFCRNHLLPAWFVSRCREDPCSLDLAAEPRPFPSLPCLLWRLGPSGCTQHERDRRVFQGVSRPRSTDGTAVRPTLGGRVSKQPERARLPDSARLPAGHLCRAQAATDR